MTCWPRLLATALSAGAQSNSTHELEILSQLSTKPAASTMPVFQLLNAPGNEALKAFFFTLEVLLPHCGPCRPWRFPPAINSNEAKKFQAMVEEGARQQVSSKSSHPMRIAQWF